jgi:hypothetical protein
MISREKEIEKEINKICLEYFASKMNGGFKEGREKLYKLYLSEYSQLKDMLVKYTLLYKLIYAEYMIEFIEGEKRNKQAIYKYIIQLKSDIDKDESFKKDHKGEYCNVLSAICDCEEIKLSKEKRLEYYYVSFNCYKQRYEKDNGEYDYIRMLNMKFNIDKLTNNFVELLQIVKEIHTINDTKAKDILTQMLDELKMIDKNIYNQAMEFIGIIANKAI